jgi:DNA-binding MarR family transcriptional regulator
MKKKLLLALDDYPFYYMWHIVVESQRKISEARRPMGITPYEWRVIFALQTFGKMSIKDLSQQTLMESSVLSRLVRTLEDRHIVDLKKNSKDRRSILVDLTATGKKFYEEIIPIVKRQLDSVLRDLSPNEIQQLHHILRKMKVNVYSSPFVLLA